MKLDIHYGRGFAIAVMLVAFVWLVYVGRIDAKSVDTYTGIVFGYLFAQASRKDEP